jgi:hypothetical protein
MASSKPKTTMNKLNRERKVCERRLDKAARKVARMNESPDAQAEPADHLQYWIEDPDAPAAEEAEADTASQPSGGS